MLIKNVLIVDGKRNKPVDGSVLVEEGKIQKIYCGETPDDYQGEIIDGKNHILAPGFIDIHSHSDSSPILFEFPDSKIFQGITTEVVGSCGISPYPCDLDDYLYMHSYSHYKEEIGRHSKFCIDFTNYKREIESLGIVNNYLSLTGHGGIRSSVLGFEDVKPDKKQLEEMCELLDKQLSEGSVGMSLGLIYPPGIFSSHEELVALGKVIAKHNKVITVHMRNESGKIFEAVDEMISVAEESGARVQLSHLKLIGKKHWGKAAEILLKVEDARKRGINVTADQYPYLATCTNLLALIPRWANEGGYSALIERIKNPDERLIKDVSDEAENRGGFDNIVIADARGADSSFNGKSISRISEEIGLKPLDTIFKIIIDSKADAQVNYFSISEEDMFEIMKKMYVSIGSDGYAYNTKEVKGVPHPRNFGTFPQFFEYVRENNLMSIEDAVYKATKLSADILNISDRGVIEEGKVADLVIFDYENTFGNSSFDAPIKRAKGVEYLFVKGVPVIFDGEMTNKKPGEVIAV